jgi:transaldolase/glucose-6-phosphate isomerase
LKRAQLMLEACAAGVKAVQHPAVSLGVALAQAAMLKQRDKVTILTSPRIASVGLWLEQLIAESTGKLGKGLIPVAEEPLGDPGAYGDDRVFVHLQLSGDESFNGRREALEKRGHPFVQIILRDELDLGEEFFCWEFAIATVGALLDINPFDEPNVKESKDNTNRILGGKGDGRAAVAAISVSDEAALAAALGSVKPGDYIALLAFIAETPERTQILQRIRATLRDATTTATTLGYGPRFLHSTGQLHKGGPNKGVFFQLVGGDSLQIPIPGQPFDFGTLKNAQALGDLQSLQAHRRRVTRIDLGPDIDAGLAALRRSVTTIATRLPATAATKG